jgi:hypothetical protein
MNEHAEAGFAPPFHAGIALGGSFVGVRIGTLNGVVRKGVEQSETKGHADGGEAWCHSYQFHVIDAV